MSFAGWMTIVAFVVILTAVALPLGSYMAKVYAGERVFLGGRAVTVLRGELTI